MGSMMVKCLSLLLLIGGGTLMPSINQAEAADYKTYPASYCRPGTSTYRFGVGTLSVGGVSNVSRDRALNINCPLVRDYMAADAGISKIQVWFRNTNPQKRIICMVVTIQQNGRPVHYQRGVSRPGVVNGSLTIQYGKDAGVWSSYTLTCTLPESPNPSDPVTIHNFRVNEYD